MLLNIISSTDKKRNSYTCKNKSGICQIRYFLQCSTENGYKYVAVTRILNVQKSCANVCQVSIGLTNVVLVDDLRDLLCTQILTREKSKWHFFQILLKKIIYFMSIDQVFLYTYVLTSIYDKLSWRLCTKNQYKYMSIKCLLVLKNISCFHVEDIY